MYEIHSEKDNALHCRETIEEIEELARKHGCNEYIDLDYPYDSWVKCELCDEFRDSEDIDTDGICQECNDNIRITGR